METVLAHAEALWERLATVPVAFSPGQVEVVVSPGSLIARQAGQVLSPCGMP
ncbi:hypothetical protein [Nocardia asiatica]|uniref:hypothetical protein n=1 Tax=Nocardia asiatica TaxID=209252 RepID=UPI0024541518|nr:hypothetical protein [Nocardia asiatica]